jgi:hypothetical protein
MRARKPNFPGFVFIAKGVVQVAELFSASRYDFNRLLFT